MRVAVVDIGTNSTRLLIADVDPASGAVEELVRDSNVTRLGEGVDLSSPDWLKESVKKQALQEAVNAF